MKLLLIQAIVFIIYPIYVWIKYDIQKSISDSWYVVNNNEKWMFTIMCFTTGILQCFHSELHSLFFFSGAALCFTGAAFSFKDLKMTKIVHFIGAGAGIILSVVALIFLGVIWVLIINIIAIIFSKAIKNGLWWYEIIAYYSILLGMLQLLNN